MTQNNIEEHDHDHHGHNHGGVVKLTHVSKAFVVGIILNLAYVIIQLLMGFHINSLALISDAGHNFLDVGALALSLLSYKLNKSKANEKYTFGFKKSSILTSLFNAVVLLISIGAIGYEALLRFRHPQPLPGISIAVVSAIGIVINGVSAFMFFRDKEKDLNVKGAFLHLASDAVVSVGLVVGGIIIYYTHLYWIDPVLSLIVCSVIIVSTWRLLTDSLRLSLDGVPDDISIDDIKTTALNVPGIDNIHHIHVWAISTVENALTAHILISGQMNYEQEENIKSEFRHQLLHKKIQHVTLETERKITVTGCT